MGTKEGEEDDRTGMTHFPNKSSVCVGPFSVCCDSRGLVDERTNELYGALNGKNLGWFSSIPDTLRHVINKIVLLRFLTCPAGANV